MQEARTPAEWSAVAARHLGDADVLARLGSAEGAYQQAGEALECALKAAVLRRQGLEHWPTRQERRDLHTHDLNALIRAAGLGQMFKAALGHSAELQQAWQNLRDWHVGSRYHIKGMNRFYAATGVTGARRIMGWLSNL